ncbi:phage exported protein [Yersinia similis]|uniref:Phage exported protein n=1 Tax=Yersinia similis TaxID=367190 RepID=A0A0T9QKQ6_9GAMM|nr:phage exported protein [Yersinia similis]
MLNIQPKAKQVTALNMLRRDWKQYRTFLLSASVGFGKTAIAAFIADGFVSRGLRVMFVAPYTRSVPVAAAERLRKHANQIRSGATGTDTSKLTF